MLGNFERTLALKEDLLHKMEQRSNLRWHPYALSIASRAYGCLGRWHEAVDQAEKAVNIAEELSDNSLVSWSLWNLSTAYTWKGDLDRAVEYGELAVQKAPTPGDKAWAKRNLGWSLCRAGETQRGLELLYAVLSNFQTGFMASEIILNCYLGEGHWLAGEHDKARQTLEKGLEITERCGARYYTGFARRLLGEIALNTDHVQAEAHFNKGVAIFREIKAENELALAYAGLGHLKMREGNIEKARAYLTKADDIFERLGTLIEPEKIREIIAELPES